MNGFFNFEFNISKIIVCVKVLSSQGEKKHRNRASHGLIYQLSGENRYNFGKDGILEVKEGQVFYLPRYSDYDVEMLGHGNCIALNFLTDGEESFPYFALSGKFGEKYRRKFENLLNLWNGGGNHNALMAAVYGLIADIQSDASQSYISPKSEEIVKNCEKYIGDRLTCPDLEISDIAKSLGISPEYLRKLFKSVHGISPKKYITDRRISLAQAIIASGDVKLTEVGILAGFSDASWFCTEFKNVVGMSPKEYKIAVSRSEV